MTQAFKKIQATPTQRLVAYMLADAHNGKTGQCDLSIATLMALTSLGERTIQDALKGLEAAGHITRVFRTGTSNQYQLTPRDNRTPAAAAPPQQPHPRGANAAPPPPQQPHLTPAAAAPNPEGTGILTRIEPVLSPDGEMGLDLDDPRLIPSKPEPKPKPKKESVADPRHPAFIKAYCEAWEKWRGAKYIFQPRDAKSLQAHLRSCQSSVTELMEIVEWCWEESKKDSLYVKGFIRQAATIHGFCQSYRDIVAYGVDRSSQD